MKINLSDSDNLIRINHNAYEPLFVRFIDLIIVLLNVSCKIGLHLRLGFTNV